MICAKCDLIGRRSDVDWTRRMLIERHFLCLIWVDETSLLPIGWRSGWMKFVFCGFVWPLERNFSLFDRMNVVWSAWTWVWDEPLFFFFFSFSFFTVVVDDFEWLNYYVRTVFRFAWIFIESMNDDNLDLLFILSALYFQLWKKWSWIVCYFPVYDVYEWSG